MNAAPLPYEVFTFADLAVMPRPQWLIRGLLVEKTTSVLSADSGSFKSFVALEMALCVATGRPFHGREVKGGNVVYVAAEGFYTLHERATAWSQHHETELPENFHILNVPLNVADVVAVRKFVEQFKEIAPEFAVLDTLSQCSRPLDENSNSEMATFIGGMAKVSAALGAHTLVVHHNSKGTGNYRGAGAIKANVDAHISLERPENDTQNLVYVRCEKQRGKPFEAFALRGQEVALPFVDEFGEPIASLVFELDEEVTVTTKKHLSTTKSDKTRDKLLQIFDELAEKFGGVKIGAWKGEVEALNDVGEIRCAPSTFWKWRTKLIEDGTIIQCGTHNGSELFARPA